MTRARITALALVNWKGVFYERYLLDRHVTALEGANGAGKTTVMIAAYVVLLPDMSRLRFTNLGESGATGGDRGIWGRLGEPSRPSYSALDLEVGAGERVIAVVRLVRGAEPTVEPTAFIITGLGPDVRLSELLLARRDDADHVPELDEIRASVVRHGGALEVFRATRDYFAALFERGITPLRLASDEDRNKLNEMLRTSMTGGISRALTSELRSFLLKEETGLADTLSRMRANLEACRRTRVEVAEARVLEREITGVYEAGLAMFTAAIHASREAAAEAQGRVIDARHDVEDAERNQQVLAAALAALLARQASHAEQLAAAREELERAAADRDRHTAARAAAGRLVALETELGHLDRETAQALADQATAVTERATRRAERERAAQAVEATTRGLGHLQEGLDELHRRAHGYRRLHRRLDDARVALGRPGLEVTDAAAAAAALAARRAEVDQERATIDRAARDLGARQRDHARVTAALATIETGVDPDGGADGAPHARARRVLARLAEDEALLGRIGELARDHAEARGLARRQEEARGRARALGLAVGAVGNAAEVQLRVSALELEVSEVEDACRAAAAGVEAAQQALTSARVRRRALDELTARVQTANAVAERLGSGAGQRVATRADAAALRDRIDGELRGVLAERAAVTAAREAGLRAAAELEQRGAVIAPALLGLRDELGAELLAARFEELEPTEAAWVEARLGPLADALIVDDPDAVATALEARGGELPTVWLVRAGTALDVRPGPDRMGGRDVVCSERFGLRITRPPEHATLGRKARERRVAALREAAVTQAATLDALAARSHRLTGWRRDAEALAVDDALELGDPAATAAAVATELAAAIAAERAHRDRGREARDRAAARRATLDELRRVLAEALFLEPPDHGVREGELAAAHARAIAAREQVGRLAEARATVAELIEVLRAPPPAPDQLAAGERRRAELAGELDRLFAAHGALEEVQALAHAAGWTDAVAALDARAGLAPALEAQHAAAQDELRARDAAVTAAELGWESATMFAQAASARRGAAAAHRERAAAELHELGGAAAADEPALARALAEAGRRITALELTARTLVEEGALTRERRDLAGRRTAGAQAALASEDQRARPAAAAWDALRVAAEATGMLDAALADRRGLAGRGSAALAAEAGSKRELLLDRVGRARGGDELARELRARDEAGAAGGELGTWQLVREWLRRRVPAQIAEVDDPIDALARLRDHLDVLEGRLLRQEGDLRGASEDVARGIDVQVRRAHGQVRRLNQQLDGVRFGSIAGIRVELRRVERMEQILRALREGAGQELLFLSSMPIEEALDEIFRRYGGGRSGGQRLLDYREYLELAVEIRRQTAETWEPASPTRLSTGEAIGVGAALMMVVLTEWERDANLLRAKRATGSLRFLFLDEANRLSRDNLGVLFELCRNLDLQLLIAAPEVARAEGNTTYRLVRQVTDDGREEVIVSGRRAVGVGATAATPAPAGDDVPDLEDEPAVDDAVA